MIEWEILITKIDNGFLLWINDSGHYFKTLKDVYDELQTHYNVRKK